MPSVKNSRKEGRKSQVLRDDDIQNRCNEDVPCTGATIQEIFSLFFSLSAPMFLSSYTLESSKTKDNNNNNSRFSSNRQKCKR